MNKEQQNKTLSRPFVTNSGYGSTLWIVAGDSTDEPIVQITVKQVESWEENNRIKKYVRVGSMHGTTDMFFCTDPVLEYMPEEKLGGKIRIVESLTPPDPENPENFVKYRKGKICRKDGKVIYRIEYYSYSALDQDVLIESDDS